MDPRFRNSKKYLYTAVYYVERKRLESQIRMSFQKGFMNQNNLLTLDDGFYMFDKVPGSFRYWVQKRYEIIAKIEQMGPFQFFFTLSCAELRWDEVLISILSQEGKSIDEIKRLQEEVSALRQENLQLKVI